MAPASEVEDHRISIVGPDIDSGAVEYPLATCIRVAGAKMQPDFESVIERKIHSWFNYIEGAMHTGQRNLFRIRISKASWEAGLRLEHFGEVLVSMILEEFGQVVDKVQVTFYTDRALVRGEGGDLRGALTVGQATAHAHEHRHIGYADDGLGDAGLGREGVDSDDRVGVDVLDDGHVGAEHQGFDAAAKHTDAAAIADTAGHFQRLFTQRALISRYVLFQIGFLSSGSLSRY